MNGRQDDVPLTEIRTSQWGTEKMVLLTLCTWIARWRLDMSMGRPAGLGVFSLEGYLEPWEGGAHPGEELRSLEEEKRIRNRSLGGVLIPREHGEKKVDGNQDKGVSSVCGTERAGRPGATGRNWPRS